MGLRRKRGRKAYRRLREALNEFGKIANARVVIKTRQHLAAIKPQDENLMLELMHSPDDLRDKSELRTPEGRAPAKAELNMAEMLIESMTTLWRPDDGMDEYR